MEYNNKKAVLYHGSCNDGFTAAWIAWKVFGEEADYIPVYYGQEPPKVAANQIYLLDFSYKRDILLAMADNASVTVLDHHKSAEAELKDISSLQGNILCKFDMEKSGARLALDYFDGLMGYGYFRDEGIESLVDYTEDRDLWKWRLPSSKAINTILQSTEQTFGNWDILAFKMRYSASREFVAEQGKAILEYQNYLIKRAVKKDRLKFIEVCGYEVPLLNTTELISEIGHELCQAYPFSISYFINNKSQLIYSLRGNGSVDVSEIAKLYGGGGHRDAAGFQIQIQEAIFRGVI